MIILDNAFSATDIEQFRNYWNQNWEKHSYVNWMLDDEVLDRRLIFPPGSEEYQRAISVVNQFCKDPVHVYVAYQRQKFPHQIHIDEYYWDSGLNIYTFVFSMDTIPEFKTILWKETARNNDELKIHIEKWGQERSPRLSNISETEDLEHTYDHNQQDYFADYLDLDGIFTYKAGAGVFFKAQQYHCTSNWLKYPQFSHREMLQIHIATTDPIPTS